MNGRPLSPGDADALGATGAQDAQDAPEIDDDVRRAWAAALAASIPADPLARALAPATDAASTGAWRPTDVSMTEFGDEVTRAGGRPVRTTSDPALKIATRLETVVSTAALGRVSFVVDRSNAGLSIVVEVASDASAAAVDAERMTLLRTLRVAGLTVLSFRILVRSGSGTAIAQRQETEGQHAKRNSSARARYGLPLTEDDDPECVDVVG
jgi:hypothetical protein